MQTFDVDIFHLKKLNDTKIYKKYLVTISNRYADLQDLDDCGDIGRELKNSGQTHTGYSKLKQNKSLINLLALELFF